MQEIPYSPPRRQGVGRGASSAGASTTAMPGVSGPRAVRRTAAAYSGGSCLGTGSLPGGLTASGSSTGGSCPLMSAPSGGSTGSASGAQNGTLLGSSFGNATGELLSGMVLEILSGLGSGSATLTPPSTGSSGNGAGNGTQTKPPVTTVTPSASDSDIFCADVSLAMAYVPMQRLSQVYEPAVGFVRGTIFPGLDKPFIGEEAVPRV